MSDRYDVVVLGGGAAGTNVAWYARSNGLTCALVEDRLVGGECSYWACIPSKALLAPSAALATARRMAGASAAVTGELDVPAVLARRDAFITGLDDTKQVDWLLDLGCELVRGRGRLAGVRTVEVADSDGVTRRLEAARAVVIATGSRPAVPPVEGLGDVGSWDSRDATTAGAIPERLLVLGGGAVGCELAQAYRRLGASEVTVLQRGGRLLDGFEPWVGELLAEAFDAEGIAVRTGCTVLRAGRADGGEVVVKLDDGSSLRGDELLVAVGRQHNTDDLGLETLGLEGGGPLAVDDRLRVRGVDGDWLYAVGDVNGRALLTHQGKYQGRLVGDIIAGRDRQAWADHRAVPQVIFTDPEVAMVGLTAQQARAAGLVVRVASCDIGAVAGTALSGGDGVTGRAQLVIDSARELVVGATFVGPQIAELLHAATVAIVGQVPLDLLWHAVPAFPTVSELWLRLLEADRGL